MKKIAIIFGILCFAQVSAFAGGTVLYSTATEYYNAAPIDPNATYVTANSNEVAASSKTTRSGKVRVGKGPKNDPNTYWNFGKVNFGSGFSSEGSSTKRF